MVVISRSPLGLRGLKSQSLAGVTIGIMSQPTRAAWIEICRMFYVVVYIISRSPLGLRGLKFCEGHFYHTPYRVAAHSGCVD